jgi:hypothetical protein
MAGGQEYGIGFIILWGTAPGDGTKHHGGEPEKP